MHETAAAIDEHTAAINYVEEIKKEFENTIIELKKSYENQIYVLKQEIQILRHHRFGRSSETFVYNKDQKLLFDDEKEKPLTVKQDKEPETEKIKSYERRKKGRKAIADSVLREVQTIDIPEEEKICSCGCKMSKIGEKTSEKFHYEPARSWVIKTVRPQYACPKCEGTSNEDAPAVKIAPVPPSMIPRSIASDSLLAYIMIHKYQDHIPFYRQVKQFKRMGVLISRQDMSNWQQKIYERLKPLYERLKDTVKSGNVLQMDETTQLVVGKKDTAKTTNGYMWLARGGPPDKKVVWYEYNPSREYEHAELFLAGFKGYLQTDGYAGYDAAVRKLSGIKHVGCFAHSRRRFFEATKTSGGSPTAEEAMQYIKSIYEIEKNLRAQKLEDNIFLEARKAAVQPILSDFKTWLDKLEKDVLPSSPVGKAISYTLNQWNKLIRYLETPHLTPDNNASENAVRPFVIGRKNWLHNGSKIGAESTCGMFTLIETAKQNGIEPVAFFKKLFEEVPLAVSPEDWEMLLPWNIFKK
jgi:transposase